MAIGNRWGQEQVVVVPVQCFRVHTGSEGAAYSHHPQIASRDGRLFATWSLGARDEDAPGQAMVLSVSDDMGESWSPPRRVAASEGAVVTSAGVLCSAEGLVAYYGVYEYAGPALPGVTPHNGTVTEARTSPDAESWSPPVRILDAFVPNLGPTATSSGRLIMPGNVSFPHTDDPTGLTGWARSGIPRLGPSYVDDSWGFHEACKRRGDRLEYCEGSFFESDDGVIHMMLRTSGRCLAVTESADDGETWSEPTETEYLDGTSKHHFGRLPDGRFFGLSTPDRMGSRTPLVMALSEDGSRFDRHFVIGSEPDHGPRIAGMHKGGRYGYPHMHITDGMVYVIHSVSKEDIEVLRFSLLERDALRSLPVIGRACAREPSKCPRE